MYICVFIDRHCVEGLDDDHADAAREPQPRELLTPGTCALSEVLNSR